MALLGKNNALLREGDDEWKYFCDSFTCSNTLEVLPTSKCTLRESIGRILRVYSEKIGGMLREYIGRIFRECSENIGRILRKCFGTYMNESWNIYGSFE